jgi:hypothetical protein
VGSADTGTTSGEAGGENESEKVDSGTEQEAARATLGEVEGGNLGQ